MLIKSDLHNRITFDFRFPWQFGSYQSIRGAVWFIPTSPRAAARFPAMQRTLDAVEMDFERTDAGASQTYQQQAGTIKRGSYVMLKDHPCNSTSKSCGLCFLFHVFFLFPAWCPGKVVEVTTFSPGKHGHAKAHLVGLDLFTGKKYEEAAAK